MSNPIDFIRDFLKYADEVGIYDHFDKDSQKMVTSPGMQALIKEARTYLPSRLKGGSAAKLMRDLPEEMREQLLVNSDKRRVIDLRTEFARRQAANGGSRAILTGVIEAIETGDAVRLSDLLRDAQGIIEGPETVYDSKEDLNVPND